jgi:ectoine hydroxylase-related dioxygenase (phytanoyl-CoA dioxygenase family)
MMTQITSQFLTLQLAVAHSDMPLGSGPTRLLPFSHLYPHGYLAYPHNPFVQYFTDHHITPALSKGDGLFFNPALFHAARENVSVCKGISVNWLQISACWTRTMQRVDRAAVLRAVWEDILRFKRTATEVRLDALVIALGDSIPSPTRLDLDPPLAEGVGETCYHVYRGH